MTIALLEEDNRDQCYVCQSSFKPKCFVMKVPSYVNENNLIYI